VDDANFLLSAHDALQELEDSGHTFEKPPSSKYQVAIKHDPDTFFDLDAKFREQHPDVQAAANDIFGRKFHKDMSGDDVYNFLNDKIDTGFGGANDFESNSHVALADEFNKRGVPGIRYFDEGSREANEAAKTRNYVTFSDNNVKILKRLGAAGALTVGGTGSVLANPYKHKDLNSYQLDHEDDGQ
jgi:hypothetical protein